MKTICVMHTAIAIAVCIGSAPAIAATVFFDTFELVDHSGGGVVEEDLNDELPGPRQPNAASTYTESGSAFIQNATVPNGSDALVLRTNVAGTPVGASADLDTDFGASLAGGQYRVSYQAQIDHAPGIAADNWHAFGLGDLSTVAAPNGADTDLGILYRLNGDWTVFLDSVGVLGGASGTTPDTGIRAGVPFTAQYDFDETGASPTVAITINATLGPVTLDLFGGALDALGPGTGFENAGRFIELRVFQGANGALLDSRFDNLLIETIPEPTSLALMALASVACLASRKR